MQAPQETQDYWSKHINALKASGLTQAAYCEQKNLNLNQLVYQKSKLDGKHQPKSNVPSSGFAAVTISPARSEGLTITFPTGVQLSGIDTDNLTLAKHIIGILK